MCLPVVCELDKGIHKVSTPLHITHTTNNDKRKDYTIRGHSEGSWIDGAEELTGLTWEKCADVTGNPWFKSRCQPGVYTALIKKDAASNGVFQLWVEGKNGETKHIGNPLDREMLIPARWPDPKPTLAEPLSKARDAPVWGSIFNTHQTWSRVIKGRHWPHVTDTGKKIGKGHKVKVKANDYCTDCNNLEVAFGMGWIEDAGGQKRSYEVETESGDIETLTVEGQGYLDEYTAAVGNNFDVAGATIVMGWGKQMSEVGVVQAQKPMNKADGREDAAGKKRELWFHSIHRARQFPGQLDRYSNTEQY